MQFILTNLFKGLKIDSPVKYRGVAIGHIERIALAPDSKLIEVILKIEADITLEENMVAQQKAVGITVANLLSWILWMIPWNPVHRS